MTEVTPDPNILTIKLCKCGRAPHRKGQRNCHFCNREANAKYRRELKRMEKRLKMISSSSESDAASAQANVSAVPRTLQISHFRRL